MFKKNRGGFTLPEVLVTVTVVAVLAAVVVPAVTQFASKGDAPSTQQDLNTVKTAVTNYVSDKRAYPSYVSDLQSYASLNLGTTATTATYTTPGLGFTTDNAFADSTVNGTKYLTLGLNNATSSKTCQGIDSLIDNASGPSAGQFHYAAADAAQGPCLKATFFILSK